MYKADAVLCFSKVQNKIYCVIMLAKIKDRGWCQFFVA